MATEKAKPKNINEKLSAVQVRIKAPKNLYNSFGKYSYRNAESILEAVKPFLTEFNLFLTINDSIQMVGDRYYVRATATLVDCETGESVEVSAYARETEEKKGMDGSQVTGATSSYARKYALNGLFLLDDTKDADSDEYHNQTNKSKPNTEASEAEFKSELKDLWEKAGGRDGFDDWYKSNTKDGFNMAVCAQMKSILMKKINDKAKEKA